MKTRCLLLLAVLLGALLFAFHTLPTLDPAEAQSSSETPLKEVSEPGNRSSDEKTEAPLPAAPKASALKNRSNSYSYLGRNLDSLASQDQTECQAAFLKLLRHLDQFPEDFADIATALRTNPSLVRNLHAFADVLPDAVSGEDEMRNRLLREVALSLADDDDTENRSLALLVLGKLPLEDPRMIDRAIRASRADQREEVQSAVSAMAAWANETSPFREDATLELVNAISRLEDPAIWLDAVRAVISAHSEVPDSLATVLLEVLAADPSPENHLRVAQAIPNHTNQANRALTVELLGTAFLEEAHSGTRDMILNDLLEVGGEESVAWARQLSLDNETLSRDARDYLEILQSGVADPVEIRERKIRRDTKRGTLQGGS